MTRFVYIYILKDPSTDAVRYVGRTHNPDKRLAAHVHERRHSRKKDWISNLKAQGSKPVMQIIERVTPKMGPARERHWIDKFGGYGSEGVLLNEIDASDFVEARGCRAVVYASCTSEDIARIDRQALRLRKVVEMEPTRAAVLLIAARKGLEVMEKEARS